MNQWWGPNNYIVINNVCVLWIWMNEIKYIKNIYYWNYMIMGLHYIPQKWFTYWYLQNLIWNTTTVFWKWLFKQLMYKNWVKTRCEILYYFFFSTECKVRKPDSKIKRTILDFFILLSPDSSKKAHSWQEYQKIKCLWPKGPSIIVNILTYNSYRNRGEGLKNVDNYHNLGVTLMAKEKLLTYTCRWLGPTKYLW